MIAVAEAIQIVKEQTSALSSELVPLDRARGRYLAEDIVADSDLPPFDRSQMDGYALRANDARRAPARLKIVGESAAGHGWHSELKPGEAVRIMTGAPVPAGADSVQQVELTSELNEANGFAVVEILEAVMPGRSIVRRGSEIKAGEIVLHSGEQVGAAAMAVLASFGYAQIKMARQPRVAVLATGSELVAVDQKPDRISAYAELAGAIVERLPLAGDDTSLLKRQIAEASDHSDVVVTSGGVSVGVYDFTKPALRELAAEIFFERVALRPGKPTVFARLPNGPLFFGLPGNPVSVSVTFNLFVRLALLTMQSAKETTLAGSWALLARSVKAAVERDSYLPATLTTTKEGCLLAEPLKWGGSSDFVGFARATSLIIAPQDAGVLEAGTKVRVIHLPL